MTTWGKIKTIIAATSVGNIFFEVKFMFPDKSLIAVYLFGLIAPIVLVSASMTMNKSLWSEMKQPSWNERLFNGLDRTYSLNISYFFGIYLFCVALASFINAAIMQNSNWKTALLFLVVAVGLLISTKFWANYIRKPRIEKPKSGVIEENKAPDLEIF